MMRNKRALTTDLQARVLEGPNAIIAGAGAIPVFLASLLASSGNPPFILMIKGEADTALKKYPHEIIDTASIGKTIRLLRKNRIKTITLVGAVTGRPDLMQFRPDLITLKLLRRILSGLHAGDDALLKNVVAMFEGEGFNVAGVHEIAPSMLMEQGPLGARKVLATEKAAIGRALAGAIELGRLDAGQGCVAIKNRIVALEGAEGTDLMLERIARLREIGRLPAKRGGVLAKLRKPEQEMRVDLPTIGIETVQRAAAAGLRGIVLHAGNTLVVDKAAVAKAADDAGIFVTGFSDDDIADMIARL